MPDPATTAIETAAVVPEDFRHGFVAAAIMVTAAETGIAPHEVAATLAESARWPNEQEWATERRRVELIVRNAKAMYASAELVLVRKRPQG